MSDSLVASCMFWSLLMTACANEPDEARHALEKLGARLPDRDRPTMPEMHMVGESEDDDDKTQ